MCEEERQTLKKCAGCKVLKNACEFNKDSSRPDGLLCYCKQCVKDNPVTKKWRKSPKGRASSKKAKAKIRSTPGFLEKEKAYRHTPEVKQRLNERVKLWHATHNTYEPNPNLVEKRCSICKNIKPVDRFALHCQSKDGYRSHCKDCEGIKYPHTPRTPEQKFIHNLRNRQKKAIAGKLILGKVIDFLGCPAPYAIERLEYQWERNFSNCDKPKQIDHIRPIESFDLHDPEQRTICFHYSNLQYLTGPQNRKKAAKYNPQDFESAWVVADGYTWRLCDNKRYKLPELRKE